MSGTARRTQVSLIGGAVALAVLLSGCTSTAEPQASATPSPVASASEPSSPDIAILSPAQLAIFEP